MLVTPKRLNVPRRLLLLQENFKNFENFGLSDTKLTYFSSKNKRYLDGLSRYREKFFVIFRKKFGEFPKRYLGDFT